ncbi:hypothetical protein QBC47DRAFT_395554 [Echria macrotheca]|uniref:DUF7708 domain-containing protein n=1 Tax=Echria macrotheca TaxID=438768 RepID=A0AAJ0F155_9PEZI|nr:hypothetical protein QBC47DRAFT_395554 [Echria macrotheca]
MAATTSSVDWKGWFASDNAEPAKKQLATTQNIKPDLVGLDQSTAAELICIKKPAHHQRVTDSELHHCLESLSLQDLHQHVAAQAAALCAAEEAWDQKRRKGWRKVRTGAQEFAVVFESFLKSFSGIVEIAKMADEAYGGAATQILSLFYATIKVKAANDEAIITAMHTITDRLPDAQIYGQVYADMTLAMMLAEAYKQTILFAKGATRYFQGRGITRAVRSIGSPTEFSDLAETLVHVFTNIRVRCEALLSQRVAFLAVQNAELLRQLKLLTDGQNIDRVRRIQKLLNRRQSDTKNILDDQLNERRKFLSLVTNHSPKELSRMRLRDLEVLPEYLAWTDTGSSLLFLHGCNHESETMPQSWLSLAVVDLVADLKKDTSSGRSVAFELCSPQETVEDIASSLISQLLDMQPSVLSDAEDEREMELRLQRNHDSGHISEKGDSSRLSEYSWVLKEVIDKYETPVYLVISHPETCGMGDLWSFIRNLLSVVAVAKNKVKILMVVRTEFWNIDERLSDIGKSLFESRHLIVARRDQTEVDVQGF